jgi:SAM-dependent methyltransferase
MAWSDLGEWWVGESMADPVYEEVVTPALLTVLDPAPGKLYLDLGCGDGRVMRTLAGRGMTVLGLDLNLDLARQAHPSVVARLPSIPLAADSVAGAYAVLVLEHLEDHRRFFAEAARVVSSSGVIAVVLNHPVWTAPGSTPITEPDGEVLWRPGSYFSDDFTDLPMGRHQVRFHHRSLGAILEGAAAAGWSLERFIEQPASELSDLPAVPRLLACRWRLLP